MDRTSDYNSDFSVTYALSKELTKTLCIISALQTQLPGSLAAKVSCR